MSGPRCFGGRWNPWPAIQTLGFAGFFGLTVSHRRFASDVREQRAPVLLNAGLTTRSGGPDDAEADVSARIKARAKRAWGRFKLAAVSSFAFVEATGPIYVGKLVGDAVGLHATAAPHDPAPRLDPALDLATRTKAARDGVAGHVADDQLCPALCCWPDTARTSSTTPTPAAYSAEPAAAIPARSTRGCWRAC